MKKIYQIAAITKNGCNWQSTCVYENKKEAERQVIIMKKDAENCAYAMIKELTLF